MMDILGQYDRQRTQTSEKPIMDSQFPIEVENAGIIVKILIKLSGGKIKSEGQAKIVMLFVALSFLFVAGFVVYNTFLSSDVSPASSTEDTRTP